MNSSVYFEVAVENGDRGNKKDELEIGSID